MGSFPRKLYLLGGISDIRRDS